MADVFILVSFYSYLTLGKQLTAQLMGTRLGKNDCHLPNMWMCALVPSITRVKSIILLRPTAIRLPPPNHHPTVIPGNLKGRGLFLLYVSGFPCVGVRHSCKHVENHKVVVLQGKALALKNHENIFTLHLKADL